MSSQLKKIVFKHNPIYKEKYIWPEKRLLSPSRILDRTSDKSFLEAWRKKVGEEEADRITKEGLTIGKCLHTYLEKSLIKFCNIGYQNHPPLVNPEMWQPYTE